MSSVTDKLFGGTDTYGMDVAADNRRTAEEFIKQQTSQGRQDVLSAYDPMTQAINQGYQRGADIYSFAIPQQLAALQSGAQEAYRMRAGALPAYQSALMGMPYNLSQMVNQTAPINVPTFQNVPSMGRPMAVEAASTTPSINLANLLSGISDMTSGGSFGHHGGYGDGGYGGGVGGEDFANGQRIN